MDRSTTKDEGAGRATAAANAATHATDVLRAPLTTLIGRDEAIAAVSGLLREPEARLVTLTGPAGVGKTRLALAVADALAGEFGDGVRAVPLAALADAQLVMPAIAQALGVRQPSERPALERLQLYLRERHMLLVLDNFEQVIAAAPLLLELPQRCPRVRLLVTSRTALRVSGEYEFPVRPLALPDRTRDITPDQLARFAAVDLFMRRTRALRPDFALTVANAPIVAEICVRLDGLPLTIELAAARINVLTPHALLARLDRQLDVLVGGPADAPERQQTLRGALAWSYDLLDDDTQWLFRRLAVFASGGTLSAIAAICAVAGMPEATLLARLGALLDKSLLQRADDATEEDGAGDEPRFRLLEALRQFAHERLLAEGEVDEARAAHAGYFVAFASDAEPQLYGMDQVRWFERVEREHDNLRAALGWLIERADAERAARVCGALVRFWAVRGHVAEGRGWLERVLALETLPSPAARARLLSGAGWLALRQKDLDRAEELCAASLTLSRELGDTAGAALALHRLGLTHAARGHHAQAQQLAEESLALFAQTDDRGWQAYALVSLGGSLMVNGELSRARTLLGEGLALFRQVSNTEGIAWSLLLLARERESAREPGKASAHVAECEPLFRALDLKDGLVAALTLRASLCVRRGDSATARVVLEEAARLARELGDDDRLQATHALAERVEAAPAPARLTAREIEVLRLVASGLTDAQIAQRLVVSPRTVNAHLRSIYGKLEVTSRAAATRAALERHIV